VTDSHRELLQIVLAHGYEYRAQPIRLRSGEWSHHFVDGKRALAHGPHLRLACEVLLDRVAAAGIDFDAVGGLTLGADQFAHGVAIVGGKDWFVVRKEPKGRGTNRLIEGRELDADARVLLVDDVVTAGGSIARAYDCILETGAKVVAAVALVDRGLAGAKVFADLGVPYLPLLTYEDLGIPPVGDGRGDAQAPE
jgi:orotate phosphoribosyltransferase